MPARPNLARAALVLAFLVATATTSPSTARRDDESAYVPWSRVVASPCELVGRPIEVVIQARGPIARWNPYVTRFGPRDYAAFDGWADEQMPWDEAEYAAPAVRLFARRGSAVEATLLGAHALQRFAARIVVREVFHDAPWAEVLSVVPITPEIGAATVFHAARAIEQAQGGNHELALAEFDQALAAPLPEAARVELQRLRDASAASRNAPR